MSVRVVNGTSLSVYSKSAAVVLPPVQAEIVRWLSLASGECTLFSHHILPSGSAGLSIDVFPRACESRMAAFGELLT